MKVLIPNDGTIALAYKTDHVMLKHLGQAMLVLDTLPQQFHMLNVIE